MDKTILQVQLESKLFNYYLPNLPQIIYGGLVHQEDLLKAILNKNIVIKDFIFYLIDEYEHHQEIEELNPFIINTFLRYLHLEDDHA